MAGGAGPAGEVETGAREEEREGPTGPRCPASEAAGAQGGGEEEDTERGAPQIASAPVPSSLLYTWTADVMTATVTAIATRTVVTMVTMIVTTNILLSSFAVKDFLQNV